MKKSLYLFSSGKIRRKGNTICFITKENKKSYVPVENTKELLVFGEVSISKKILEFFTQKEIIVHYFSYYGYYMGTFYPREHYNSGYMILNEAKHYLDEEKRIILARKFVTGAADNTMKVLEYYSKRGDIDISSKKKEINSLMIKVEEVKEIDKLMSIEGRIKELYFQCWDAILKKEDFRFQERTRRPPKNHLNALISFGNSLLYVTVLSEIYKTHLDPRIGFLHATNFRRFSLNLDVAEVFKPIIVDRLIFSLINKNEILTKHFSKELNGILLNEEGRKIFVKQWDKRLAETIKQGSKKKSVSYRRLIRNELYKIEKHLMGDKIYKPFISYW